MTSIFLFNIQIFLLNFISGLTFADTANALSGALNIICCFRNLGTKQFHKTISQNLL